MKDFPNMFLEDFYGIKVFSSTAPMSIAPYGMTLGELKKLKIQLQELLDQGCVIYTDHKSIKYLLVWEKLNLRQRHLIKPLKDYDCVIEYHSGKANVVADALSQKLIVELRAMFGRLSMTGDGGLLVEIQVKPILLLQINERQLVDDSLGKRIQQVEEGSGGDFELNSDGILNF
ncbi:uncharacterized protein LOC128042491 [Gossypium raimondii]|uniref:uncharacterized protein LOC128042491 n=1 Tax=Gossypium raimondii TaxID=29730 RepID=UPI00227BF380|nr:uncharacterized protein LOC128042491 [Gossypium raimondii]